jgi:drug/metabolite transporter (DMT)-like permease
MMTRLNVVLLCLASLQREVVAFSASPKFQQSKARGITVNSGITVDRNSNAGINITGATGLPTGESSFPLEQQQQLQQLQRRESIAVTTTTQDDTVDAPASVVFYDDFLDDAVPDGVVCARGICVLRDDELCVVDEELSLWNRFLCSYLGPRALLAGASVLYGTNFPLGAIMNESLPPSATTSARMLLAALALSPFLPNLNPKFAKTALLGGCLTATAYLAQSQALMTTSPATVAFLGAATVVVCPILEAVVNKKPMSLRDAPQTWLAALLCLGGVGVLELFQNSGDPMAQMGWGDVLALVQAVGFGSSFILTERMMSEQPDQALPITAVQVSTTAAIAAVWAVTDGWIGQPGCESFALPGLLLDPEYSTVAMAVLWTGVVTTALNRVGETTGLGRMSTTEASVILATEPLWAALFAALWLHEGFGINDIVGGAMIVLACLANTLNPSSFSFLFKDDDSAANPAAP